MKKIYCLSITYGYGTCEFDCWDHTVPPKYSYNQKQLEDLKKRIEKKYEKFTKKDYWLNVKVTEITGKDSLDKEDIDEIFKDIDINLC